MGLVGWRSAERQPEISHIQTLFGATACGFRRGRERAHRDFRRLLGARPGSAWPRTGIEHRGSLQRSRRPVSKIARVSWRMSSLPESGGSAGVVSSEVRAGLDLAKTDDQSGPRRVCRELDSPTSRPPSRTTGRHSRGRDGLWNGRYRRWASPNFCDSRRSSDRGRKPS